MDIFGIKKRKEEQRKKEEQRFILVKKDYEVLKQRAVEISDHDRDFMLKRKKEMNEICPKCNSTDVNDRIKRLQGGMSGSISGSIFGFSGHSHGSLDTNEVNKCNNCHHEWKKYEGGYRYYSDILENSFCRIMWLCEEYNKAMTAKIDPKNLDENYDSDEDKRKDLLDKILRSYRLKDVEEFFKDISIESIEELSKREEIWGCGRFYIEEFQKHYNVKVLEDLMCLKHMKL